MKRNGWHLKFAVAILMVVMMLTSIAAVTAFAASGGAEQSDIATQEGVETRWYTVNYTPAADGDVAKLDIRVKTAYSSFKDITKEDIKQLKDSLEKYLYDLAFDSIMGSSETEAQPVMLMSERPAQQNIPDIADIDIENLEEFLRTQLSGAEAKEKLDAVMSGDFDTVIQIAIDKYVNEKGYEYDDIQTKVHDVISEAIEIIYEDEPEVIEQKKSEVEQKVVELVEEVEELHEAGESVKISIDDLKTVDAIYVDTNAIFLDGYFKYDAIIDLINELPKPDEIENYTDGEMVLDYDIRAHFIFGNINFKLSVGLLGDCDEVRKVMGILADYVDYGMNPDRSFYFNVSLPEKFADMLIKAIDKLDDDAIKHKVFAALSKNGGDVEALIKGLEFSEVVEILEKIDFEGVLTSEFVSQYVDLSDLTNEEIVEKVKNYENYFNKAKKLALKLIDKLPEGFADKNLFSAYKGEGYFEVNVDKNVNLEKVLSSVSSKYGPLVASFIDKETVNVKATATLQLEKINRVTYMLGDDVYADGFLPAGADVAYFANVTEYNGEAISAWMDEKGNIYTEMPDFDIVLYAWSELKTEVSAGVDATYAPGQEHVITVNPVYYTSGSDVTYTYEWFKDGVSLGVSDKNTLTVSIVKDSGEYTCVVKVVDGNVTKTATSAPITVSIAKAKITFESMKWIYDEVNAPFVYNGTEYSVVLEGIPTGFTVTGYNNNTATNAGSYEASYNFEVNENYEFAEGAVPVGKCAWVIRKAAYDLSGIKFADKTVTYDGNPHGIVIEGTLPDGVSVSYSESQIKAGTYTITATFTVADPVNYEIPAPKTATLTIESPIAPPPEVPTVNNFGYEDENGRLIVDVDVKEGLEEGTEINVKDKTYIYQYIDLSGVLDDGKVGSLGAAYDISFSKDGIVTDVYGKSFTVRLLIPESLKNNDNLMVVHIADSGEYTLMESERDGDYMVFETNHFSIYAIITVSDEADYTLLWILLGVGLGLILIAVIVLLIIKHRKNKKNPEEENTEAPDDKPDDKPETDAAEETVEQAQVEESPEEQTAEKAVTEEAPAVQTVEQTPAEEASAKPVIIANDDDSIIIDGEVIYVRYRSSFTSRLIQSEAPMQDYYTVIKNHILSYKGIKTRTSWNYESFNKGRVQCVKMNVKGKYLALNLALDPKEYNVNKYHFTDMSDNPKYQELPMLLKVRSERSLKYALELIDEVMRKLSIEQGEVPAVDYHMPYESNASLAERGLVKLILPAGVKLDGTAILREANVSEVIGDGTATDTDAAVTSQEEVIAPEEPVTEETVAEEPIVEEPTVQAPAAEEPKAQEPKTEESAVPNLIIGDDDKIVVDGNVVNIRYRSSFESRLIQASAELQDYYTALKNYLLSFKGVKSRTSWNYESFNKGRTQCARLNIKGKTLTINLALTPEAYNINKYHFTDMSDDPKFDKLPMLLKVRSARALKDAIELIDELMKSMDIAQGEVPAVDYHQPYETNRVLAGRGLMKIILPAGVKLDATTVLREENVDTLLDSIKQDGVSVDSPVEAIVKEESVTEAPVIEEPVFVDAKEADELVADEVAEHSIEEIDGHEVRSGKMCEINIDVICENFEDGDVVTLKELQKKRLVSSKAGRVKVLAHGRMTKSLTVVADKFSLQAVKMITLAGGTAKKYN